MIGLIILIVGIVYLALLIWTTRFAYRWAKVKGLSKRKCLLAGGGGFLAIYLPVFWDHIPTVVTHQYYCKTEAGFWVYKTPEQWKRENPNVAQTLTYSRLSPLSINSEKTLQITHLNERFEGQRSFGRLHVVPVTIFTDIVIDRNSGDILAKYVTVGSGHGNMLVGNDWRAMKFWLKLGPCEGEKLQFRGAYESIQEAYKKIGEQK